MDIEPVDIKTLKILSIYSILNSMINSSWGMSLSQLEILKKLHLRQVLHVMKSVHFSGHSFPSHFIHYRLHHSLWEEIWVALLGMRV